MRSLWPAGRCRVHRHLAAEVEGEVHGLLKWAIILAVLAAVAGLLGFTGIAGGLASIAKVLFFIFLVCLIVVTAAGVFIGKKLS